MGAGHFALNCFESSTMPQSRSGRGRFTTCVPVGRRNSPTNFPSTWSASGSETAKKLPGSTTSRWPKHTSKKRRQIRRRTCAQTAANGGRRKKKQPYPPRLRRIRLF